MEASAKVMETKKKKKIIKKNVREHLNLNQRGKMLVSLNIAWTLVRF